ncbi:MAG TPA: hypothetical protein VNZ57_07455, partial [Longimicrobiales bacterium]|nr:hypothetical protein [Longimicrobiales bacterium]
MRTERGVSVAGRLRRTGRPVLLGLALVTLAACAGGDDPGPTGPNDPPDSPGQLVVTVTGRLERGMTVDLTVTRDGSPVPEGNVTWSATPANAAEFPAPGKATLRQAGSVTINASVSGASGSRAISVATPPQIVFDMVDGGRRQVFVASLDGQGVTRLTQGSTIHTKPTAAQSKVVFTRDSDGQLYSVPLAGGAATQITQFGDPVDEAALSRDGQRLAFTREASAPAPKIWVGGTNGANAARATPPTGFAGAIEASPSWSPVGDRLVYMSTRDGTANLYILNVNAGTIEPLLTDPVDLFVEPAWSPDGQWVAFTSDM